jgi:hypothetical protein
MMIEQVIIYALAGTISEVRSLLRGLSVCFGSITRPITPWHSSWPWPQVVGQASELELKSSNASTSTQLQNGASSSFGASLERITYGVMGSFLFLSV